MAAEMITAIFIILLFIFLSHWYRNRNNSLITNWPIVGMLPGLLRNSGHSLDFSTHILRRCGGTFEFKGPCFPRLDFVLTSDPVNINHILNKNFANYEKGSAFREIFEPFGEGIFTLDSDRWKNQRRMIQALFRNDKFAVFRAEVMQKKLEKGLIPIFEQAATLGTEVDLEDVFERFDFDTMSLFALGCDPNSLSVEFPDAPGNDAIGDLEEAVLYRHLLPASLWKFQKWLQIGEEKKLSKAKKILDDLFYSCISSRRENFRKNKKQVEEETFDLLTSLLQVEEDQRHSDAFEQSDKFVRDSTVNLMLAGVSGGLSWFFWNVATNPSVESKILEEIKRISPICKDKNMICLSEDELHKFIYLHAVLCESSRLYPSGPTNHRTAIQADILPSGHRVNPGSRVLISVYSMGRMEEIWGKDCLEFKPERWISDQGDIIHVPSYKFTSFSSGPRTCLGKDISFPQMKTVAIALLKNYQVEVVEGHSAVLKKSIFLKMKEGLKVKIKRRYV